MTSYSAIANSEIDPDSPITTGLMTRLRDNPLAISQLDVTAPALALSRYDVLLTSQTWNVPVNVNFAVVDLTGAGAGSGAAATGASPNVTPSTPAACDFGGIFQAGSGLPGQNGANSGGSTLKSGGLGGTPSGGDINWPGQPGSHATATFQPKGGDSRSGFGGINRVGITTDAAAGGNFGGGASAPYPTVGDPRQAASSGGGGSKARKKVDLTALASVSVTVPSGGTPGQAAGGPNGAAGAQALCEIWY